MFIKYILQNFLFLLSSHYYIFLTHYLLKQLRHDFIKAPETRIYILSKLVYSNNTFSSCLFFFFFIIELYFLIPAVIAQIFNPTTEHVMSTEIQTKEANAEIETQPVTVEAKISNCLS